MRAEPAAVADDTDDHRWVAAALAGDPAAFRALFEHHAPSVRRFLRDLARDAAFADEATQETFVRAHARLATLRDDQRLRPWLLGIARRVFLEELRRRRPRVAAEPVGDEVASPEADLLVAEEVRLFRAALARLSAELVGLTTAQVRNELHRGRQDLRGFLAPYFEERS